jgi:ankyrin repeat protein
MDTDTIPADDPTATALITAIRAGDVDAVSRLVEEKPELAGAKLSARRGTRTPLHVAADWPGYFPNGPQIVRVLIEAGADPNVGTTPEPSETPLHWAASSDDADVAAALIDGGADLEVPNGSIGTPLDNAIGYGCWNVARLLLERGARVDKLWHAAALGMLDRVEELLAQGRSTTEEISQAFWHACAGGQRRAAERLLAQGADLNWEPDYAKGTPLDAAGSFGTRQENVINWLRELGAASANQTA